MEVGIAEIESFLEELTRSERQDDETEINYFSLDATKGSVTCCTTSARLIAKKFGGRVFGLTLKWGNPRYAERVGYLSGGHDFAIIGRLLVDWWGVNVEDGEGRKLIYNFDDPADAAQIRLLYGDPEEWSSSESTLCAA